jgi:hypothetical protein
MSKDSIRKGFVADAVVACAAAAALLTLAPGTAHGAPRDCHALTQTAACPAIGTDSPNERRSPGFDRGSSIGLGGPDTLPQQHN